MCFASFSVILSWFLLSLFPFVLACCLLFCLGVLLSFLFIHWYFFVSPTLCMIAFYCVFSFWVLCCFLFICSSYFFFSLVSCYCFLSGAALVFNSSIGKELCLLHLLYFSFFQACCCLFPPPSFISFTQSNE